MTNAELLQAGFSLMLAGIGFVMLFLLILIYAIQLMSVLINRFFPEADVPATPVQSPSQKLSSDFDHLRPAIVAAVVHHHRKQQLK